MTMKYILLILLFAGLIQCWNYRTDCYELEGLNYAASTKPNRLDRVLDSCGALALPYLVNPSAKMDSWQRDTLVLNCYLVQQKRKKCDKEMNDPWPGNPYIWDKRYGR